MTTHNRLLLILMSALLLSVSSVKAVSAAGATIAFDKAVVVWADGTLEVTLTDSTVPNSIGRVDESVGFAGVPHVTKKVGVTGGVPPNGTFQVQVSKFPILDSGNGGGINYLDVFLSSTDPSFGPMAVSIGSEWHPFSVSGSNGLVTLKNLGSEPVPAGIPFTVGYWASVPRTATVRVSSSTDSSGFDLALRETSLGSGIFRATVMTGGATDVINAANPAAAPRPRIAARTGGVVTVSYSDGGTARTATAAIESPPRTCGDLNDDGSVSVVDIIISLKISVGQTSPTAVQTVLGDLNRDSNINVLDIILGLQFLVGKIHTLGCGLPE